MPWCDDCSKFWSPNSLPRSGACPTCGRVLTGSALSHGTARSAAPDAPSPAAPPVDGPDDYKAPWHFKLMVGMAAVYLSWRLVQLVSWLL